MSIIPLFCSRPPFSEVELISLIISGQKRLFKFIMGAFHLRLYKIGMSILHDDIEVEDTLQNTYIKAYEHLNRFKQKSSLATWISRIMINECLLQKKRNQLLKAKTTESSLARKIKLQSPEEILINKELHIHLENALKKLPERYRQVFVSREVENLSVKETSKALNIKEPNVKTALYRAKTMLRKDLTIKFYL